MRERHLGLRRKRCASAAGGDAGGERGEGGKKATRIKSVIKIKGNLKDGERAGRGWRGDGAEGGGGTEARAERRRRARRAAGTLLAADSGAARGAAGLRGSRAVCRLSRWSQAQPFPERSAGGSRGQIVASAPGALPLPPSAAKFQPCVARFVLFFLSSVLFSRDTGFVPNAKRHEAGL